MVAPPADLPARERSPPPRDSPPVQLPEDDFFDDPPPVDSFTERLRVWLSRHANLFNDVFTIPSLHRIVQHITPTNFRTFVAQHYRSAPAPQPIPHDNMRPMIRAWTNEGVRLRFTTDVPHHRSVSTYAPPNTHMAQLLEDELLALVAKGHLRPVARSEAVVTHPVFAVPKDSHTLDKIRLVYDARFLNDYIDCPHFSLPRIPDSIRHLPRGSWSFVSDISSGYHHVPIHPDSQQFLGLHWKGQTFVWTVLPFGLNVAPFIFQKWLESYIHAFKRSRPLSTLQYIDDILVTCKTKQEAEFQKSELLSFFTRHNIKHNPNKTSEPKTKFRYLGYTIDSVDGTVSIDDARLAQIRRIFDYIRVARRVTRKFLQKLCGLLNWSRRGCRSISNLVATWYDEISKNKFIARPDTRHMDEILRKLGTPTNFRVPIKQYRIYTDATLHQGAYILPTGRQIIFPIPDEYSTSSFRAEFYTSYVAIMASISRRRCIKLWTDNQGSRFALAKGTSHVPSVHRLLYRLHDKLEKNDCRLIVDWIPSEENPADAPSRMTRIAAAMSPFCDWVMPSRATGVT